MRLANLSVPKINAPCGNVGCGGEGEPVFYSHEEEFMEALRPFSGGKMLLVVDETGLDYLVLSKRFKAVCLVWNGDLLSLFACGEVSLVVGVGGSEVLSCVRYFGKIARVPVYTVSRSWTMDGVFNERAFVTVGGEKREVELSPSVVGLDVRATDKAEAYARICLDDLMRFETYALKLLDGEDVPETTAFTPEEVTDALLARPKKSPPCPAWETFRGLYALYVALFKCGSVRKFVLPRYDMRPVPEVGYFTRRALRLDAVRSRLLRDLESLDYPKRREEFCSLGGVDVIVDKKEYKELAIRHGGLCALSYDLGLLENL